jgi:hypothetical protein
MNDLLAINWMWNTGKVFEPVNGSPTKKEAEQNAALVALHHLHNLWINRSDEPDSDEEEEVNNAPSTEAATTPDPFGLDSTEERSLYQDLTGDGGVLKKIVRWVVEFIQVCIEIIRIWFMKTTELWKAFQPNLKHITL